MDSITSKLDLMEKGTRYQHYYELKEVFLLGIDVIDRMNQSHISEMDIEMKRKLTTAVDMIERRIGYLCNYSMETSDYSDLAREIDHIQVHRTSLTSRSPNDTTPKQDSNRKSTQEDSGGETENA